jgi:hypothetical protein
MTSSFSHFGEDEPLENRGRVVKMALVYMPIAVVSLVISGVALFNILSGDNGFIFMLAIFGFIGLLTGYQGWQYLKDLKARPMEFHGDVMRKWHKGNVLLFFMPSYYIMVDSKVFIGAVARVERHGAYVRLESGAEGYVPRKELDIVVKRDAQDMVKLGEQVYYKITGVDASGVYRLSCRRAEERSVVGKIFTITRVEYAMLLEQDLVKVTCYPNSATVERLERYDESEKRFIPATTGATF